jgi:hypothetical protein
MANAFHETLEDFIVNSHKIVTMATGDNRKSFMQIYGFPILVYVR